jgi:hypothetical protein
VRLLLKQKKISKMIGKTLRKIIIFLIITAPIVSYEGCKKQAKCGCGNDVQGSFIDNSFYIYYNDTYSTMYLQLVGDLYDYYYPCSPSKVISKLDGIKSGDVVQVSGSAYWNCNYTYQSSNSPYQSAQRVFDIEITDLFIDLYGKNKPATKPLNSNSEF